MHASGTSLMIYRKDLAKKLGIEPPKTWDDFVKIAEKLTIDENKDGKPEIYGITMPGDNLFINILVGEMITANGGKLFDDKQQVRCSNRQADDRDAGLLEAAGQIHAARLGRPRLSRHLLQSVRAESRDDVSGFGRGAVADRAVCAEEHAQHQDLDVWRKPHGPSGNAPASQVDEETWMLFKGSANPELAKEFLEFFYKDENYVEYIKSVPIHFFPITKSLRNSPPTRTFPMVKRWAGWLRCSRKISTRTRRSPTLIIDWEDMTNKPYLLQCSAPACCATW